MKKAIVVIISALYVVSIVIIAFFGSEVRTKTNTTYVKDITLTLETYSFGGKTIYDVNKNSSWTIETSNKVAKYTIVIRDYNYFYESMGNAIELDATVSPENATYPQLDYKIFYGDSIASIIGEKTFSFNEQLTARKSSAVKIETTDNSRVSILVAIAAVIN